jgi:hypothetical protein
MKEAILGSVVLFSACHVEPLMTFGLEFRARGGDTPPGQAQVMCRPPGESDGNSTAGSIDHWEIDEPPPHLFLEATPDAEENLYRVSVYSASERDAHGIWWKASQILAERTYDGEFGERGQTDSFVVDFEGEQYTVDVLGLPPSASCP